MKRYALAICVLLTLASMFCIVNQVYAGKPGGSGCADVPISWMFIAPANATAAISNDDPTRVYKEGGSEGVKNSVIHYGSSCTGSHDATLALSSSKRAIRYQFPAPIPGSIIYAGPPAFAGGNSFLSKSTFRVANITGYTVLQPNIAATFYARVTASMPGPDGETYSLRFHPSAGACPGDYPCVPDFHGGDPAPGTGSDPLPGRNSPEETSWVKVTYTPRNPAQPYSTTNYDQWVVDGSLVAPDGIVQRGMLLWVSQQAHVGQYSMPFKIIITALAKLPE